MKAFLVLLLALPVLAACNTVAGVGQDVEAAGKVVKDTARDVQEDLKD